MEREFLLGEQTEVPPETPSRAKFSATKEKADVTSKPNLDTSMSAAARLVVVVNHINLVTTFVTSTPR